MLLLSLLIAFDGLVAVFSMPAQTHFAAPATKPRARQGRFLHITDIHPDPYYREDKSLSTACHRKKPKKNKEGSGYFGTPFSGCDSPFRLSNFTLDYLDKNWASEIDFVIWTGDNARHDNDRKFPRTPAEIYDLNRAVASKMEHIFSSRGIPVVPSLGNNDVWPHNIMTPGPNSITNEFSSIWAKFIPFPNHQVFQRGAYYSVEVVPDQLAIISLNTMYFYDSNKAVGGCPYTERDDPGNLELDWLEVQLKSFRYRDMQVWISGHVPPSPGNYFPECYVRYVELSLRFQDTILGHLFGVCDFVYEMENKRTDGRLVAGKHMNADHFSFVEAVDLEMFPDNDENVRTRGPGELYTTLLQEFAALPKESKDVNYDDYGVINVSPPVVPNPYLPTFRIFSYNVSTSEQSGDGGQGEKSSKRKHGHRRGDRGNKEAHCKEQRYRDTWRCHLNESWYSDAESPSRKNKEWTPLGYAQYYIPELMEANETRKPRFKLEYLTYDLGRLYPQDPVRDGDGFRYPVPLRHLPSSLAKGGVEKSKYAVYGLKDLTIPSWVSLARRLANPDEKKLRRRFREYMYLGGEEG